MLRRHKFSPCLIRCAVVVFTAAMLCFTPNGSTPVQAQTSAAPACAVTPEFVGGQGFNVLGLGFNVLGLGFNVLGLGFNVLGLGFNVLGLGLDPLLIAAEIQNNVITTGWLNDLEGAFAGGPGYNTVKTAILVIDDRSHGDKVLLVVNALKAVFDLSNIQVEFIDVGDGATGYNADIIASRISQRVAALEAQGVQRFILNMSFGLVPCDETVVIGGKTYNWSFSNALNRITASNQPAPQVVRPVLECVRQINSSTFVARFGYLNEAGQSITIPLGNHNKLTGSFSAGALPTLFERGRQQNVFEITFNGNNLVWTLRSPNGSTRTSTANRHSRKCGGPLKAPAQSTTPLLECVAYNGGTTYTARFRYTNSGNGSVNNQSVYRAAGPNNFLSPGPADQGQPTYFLRKNSRGVAFSAQFSGASLTWTVKGLDGVERSVTATPSSPVCIDDVGYGLSDYLKEVLNVPDDLVDDFLTYLLVQSPTTDNPLSSLRSLLAGYLARSADTSDPFQAFPVASSGNFRPWLGETPLAPARWPEAVAVGATLGNNGDWWRFSHRGNVLAPGVSFPQPNNVYYAGTSFATPFVSAYLAHFATYPNACTFPIVDGVARPPLTKPDNFNNRQVQPDNINPFVNAFTCVKPQPVPQVCYATEVVSFTQGKRKDGRAIPVNRSDPSKALGAPQNDDTLNFVSLGFIDKTTPRGGEIVLYFERAILNGEGPDLRVWETSFNDRNRPWSNYPEAVRVYASNDGVDWRFLGQTTDKDQAYDLSAGNLSVARYIRLVDVTDPSRFGGNADGFDVDAVEGFMCDGSTVTRIGSNLPGADLRGLEPTNPGGQPQPSAPGVIELPPPPDTGNGDGWLPLPPPPPAN